MRVLAIVGSMRSNRVTETTVRAVISEMRDRDGDLVSDVIFSRDLECRPCRVVCHSSNCAETLYRCSIRDDVPEVLRRIEAADAVILGAPHYFRGPPAGFHTMVERLQAMAFFHEAAGHGHEASPILGKPCGLVGVCEYSNPQVILEYLHDVCRLLRMRPVRLPSFPYLGVGVHGEPDQDKVFHPLQRTREMAGALLDAVRAS